MAISARPNCCYERWGDSTNRPTKRTLTENQANELVATLIGRTNIIPATLRKRERRRLYSSLQMAMPLECQSLIRLEAQIIHVSIRS